MGLEQFMKALSMLPQIVESIKKMDEKEKMSFVEKLGLDGEEKETAYNILTCFQEGKPLSPDQQGVAQKLLEKAMEFNKIDLAALFGNLGMGIK
ncbi:MAG: hypothetical protein QHH10_04630 [Peptococcaceae bacterium]|jgi:hypothetical protein|nr:hypothetical protein [Peptococcaceae bacterium]MDH7524583.1 hypothetical protein [Peptococcaceae bacterium]